MLKLTDFKHDEYGKYDNVEKINDMYEQTGNFGRKMEKGYIYMCVFRSISNSVTCMKLESLREKLC